MQVKRTLTRKQTNEIKAHPEIYKFVPQNQRFDYFGDTPFYDFECRLVRFKITKDTYVHMTEKWCACSAPSVYL